MQGTFFARHLVSMRQGAGKSKNQVIKDSGIDRSLYYKLEGDRQPNPDVQRRLVGGVNQSFDDIRKAMFDDIVGPGDFERMRDWLFQEDQDRKRRLDPLFWTEELSHFSWEIQLSRLFKGLGYEVEYRVEETGDGSVEGLLLTKGDQLVFVPTSWRDAAIVPSFLELVAKARDVVGATGMWVFSGYPYDRATQEAADQLGVELKTLGDLSDLARTVLPLFPKEK